MGLAAHLGQADVRIAARAPSAEEAENLLDGMEDEVRAVIGDYIYSTTPDEAVETVLARLLVEADATVALLESVTDGAISNRLKDGAGPENAQRILEGDPEKKAYQELLSQPPTSEIAGELALKLRNESSVSHGLAVITSGRPDETFHSHQGGETWIGCAGPERTEVARFPFGGADRLTNAWVGNRAMDLLRRILLNLEV